MIGYIFIFVLLHVINVKGFPDFYRTYREEVTTESSYAQRRHGFYDERHTTTNHPNYNDRHHMRNTTINTRNTQSRETNRQNNNKGNMERDIIYPDSRHNYLPKRPSKKCVFGDLCEESDDYPAEYIKNMLKNKPELNNFFSSEELKPDFISNRLGEDDTQSLCATVGHTSYPKTAKNTDNVDKFIVNVEGYKQGLVFETCVQEATCRFSELMPNDYEFGCKQRYVVRRLMALNEEGKPALDRFEIPSCCVCTYKKK